MTGCVVVGEDLCGTGTASRGREGRITDLSDREVFAVVTGDGGVNPAVGTIDVEGHDLGWEDCTELATVLRALNILGLNIVGLEGRSHGARCTKLCHTPV